MEQCVGSSLSLLCWAVLTGPLQRHLFGEVGTVVSLRSRHSLWKRRLSKVDAD